MTTPPQVNWLLLSILTLGALWLFYYLALRRERFFQYNRILLLLAPPLAAVLPLLHLPTPWLSAAVGIAAPAPLRLLLPTVTVGAPAATPAFSVTGWLLLFYGAGVAAQLGRLTWQLWQLRRFARTLPAERHEGYTLRYTSGRRPTGSFGRTVFWNDSLPLAPAEAAQVLAHELVHVRQHHTRDRLWLAAWQALLWPNPFVHLLPRALDLTHEYLADAAVAPAAPTAYVGLLARQAIGWRGMAPTLAHAFFSSSTLIRIAMLNRPNVARRWKQWLALPVGAALLFVVGCEKSSTAEETVAPQVKTSAMARSLEVRKVPGSDKLIYLVDGKQIGGEYTKEEIGEVLSRQLPPPPPTLSESSLPVDDRLPVDPNKIYTYVEQMPEYPGGMGGLMRYIGEHVHYPKVAIAKKVQGKAFVNFVIAKDGTIRDVKMMKGIGQDMVPGPTPPGAGPEFRGSTVDPAAAKAMNEEALRVVRELPRWTPGRQKGQPVAVSFTIPISYALK